MNDLSKLSDSELKEYYSLYKEMISESGRAENVKINSYDLKFAYHIIRLLSECEQIMLTGDLDLQEKGRREHMKAIRRGEVKEEEIKKWASEKELQLEKLYHESKLPENPKREEIRQLLLNCLESHYGSLEKFIVQEDWAQNALREVDVLLGKFRNKLY